MIPSPHNPTKPTLRDTGDASKASYSAGVAVGESISSLVEIYVEVVANG
jgi:hypothetical protein